MRISYPTLTVIAGSLAASTSLAQPAPAPAPKAASEGAANTAQPQTVDAAANQLLDRLVNNAASDISLYEFNYGEPGSPVLPLVGVQADQITRVESVRRFGLGVLTGLASNETGPAIAIDFSPFWLLARGPISLADYRSYSDTQRIIARTKVAAAASRGNEANSVPSSLVFSLSTKLLGSSDPLRAGPFESCVRDDPDGIRRFIAQARAEAAAATQAMPINDARETREREVTNQAMERMRSEVRAAYQVCADRQAVFMSRQASFDIGAGFRLTGAPGDFRNLHGSGTIVWATYATGVLGGGGSEQNGDAFSRAFGIQARAVAHARYTFSEDIFDQNGVRTGQADSSLLVAGIESVPIPRRPELIRWSLQAGWTRQEAPNAMSEDRDYWRFLGIGQFRIREGLWLNATVGRVQGRGVEDDTYVSVGFTLTPGTGSAGIDNFYRRTR